MRPLGIRTCFRPRVGPVQSRWPVVGQSEGPNSAQQRTGVVYRIPCGDCPKNYIGQTSKTLKYRLTEHNRALRSGEAAQSEVAEHAMKEDHTIKWEEADMVDHDPRYCQRCTLEAWHIRAEQQKMNRDDGSLLVVHNPLIHMSHCPHTPSWLLDYNILLIVVNPQLWRIGRQGKRNRDRAWTRDLRFIVDFQPRKRLIPVEILRPQSPFSTGHGRAAISSGHLRPAPQGWYCVRCGGSRLSGD